MYRIRFLIILMCLVIIASCTGQVAQEGEATPKTEKLLLAKLAWTYSVTTSEYIHQAFVDNGVAFFIIGSENERIERVEAYDLIKRQILWTTSNDNLFNLQLDDYRLYIINSNSVKPEDVKLLAISRENGKVLWSISLPTHTPDTEIETGGEAVFIGSGNSLYKLDANNGNILWQKTLPHGFIINSAWFGGSTVYSEYNAMEYYGGMLVVRLSKSDRGALVAYNTQNGDEIWHVAFELKPLGESGPMMISSSPIFQDGNIFFVSWEKQMFWLDSTTGEIDWKGRIEFPVVRPMLQGERAYIPYFNGLKCIEITTGSTIWDTSLNLLTIRAPLLSIDGNLVTILEESAKRSELIKFDSQTGQTKSILDLSSVDKCIGCVMAMRAIDQSIYVVFRHSIVMINLLHK